MEILILFENKDQKVMKYLNFDGVVFELKHLSMQGLVGNKEDINGNKLKNNVKEGTSKKN